MHVQISNSRDVKSGTCDRDFRSDEKVLEYTDMEPSQVTVVPYGALDLPASRALGPSWAQICSTFPTTVAWYCGGSDQGRYKNTPAVL